MRKYLYNRYSNINYFEKGIVIDVADILTSDRKFIKSIYSGQCVWPYAEISVRSRDP